MATAFKKASFADKPRRDIYAEVTATIIAQLEAGTVPWACPWSKDNRPVNASMPYSAATGRPYSGVNVLLLWGAQIAGGYSHASWLTYKGAQDAGGNVRKGEKGTMIVYASRFIPASERAKPVDDQRSAAFLKSFCVFNVEQCEGLPESMMGAPAPISLDDQHAGAEALLARTGASIRIGGNEAFYSPGLDFIQLPPMVAFKDQINYYRTALHELTHWSGHKSRLDRNILNKFGTKDYAKEELVAEMGSAFLCAGLGIETTCRHSDYIANWLGVLREDNKAVFRAASMASKAASFLLGDAEVIELDPEAGQ